MLVPLIVQMVLLCAVAGMEIQAERDRETSVRAMSIANAVDDIHCNVYEVLEPYVSEATIAPADLNLRMKDALKRIREDFALVRKYTADDLILQEKIGRCEQASESMVMVIQNTDVLTRRTDSDFATRTAMLLELRSCLKTFLNTHVALKQLGEESRRRAGGSPEVQTTLRRNALILIGAIGLFNVVACSVLVVFLTRGITNRLHQLSDNSLRVAAGVPVGKVLLGDDEIARLDSTFRSMVAIMQEDSRRQNVIVANALDTICTLSATGKFVSANPAAARLFGRDVTGVYFVDVVQKSDVPRALSYFEALTKGTPLDLGEIGIIGGDGKEIDTLWSAHWSPEEESVFCVIHDISERTRAERLKQEVMAMITHDLRSPLNTLQNVMHFFDTEGIGQADERSTRYMIMGHRNLQRMLDLVNDLLDIEKIKSGTMTLEKTPVLLAQCFSATRESTASYAEDLNVLLQFEDSDCVVDADESELARVLTNLVSNALKFTPAGKQIVVSAVADGGNAVICVADEGPGLTDEESSSIFGRFQQSKDSRLKHKGGSGLGLTICKAIVELHGGTIWVESKVGQGSSFKFTLPLVPASKH